MSAVMLGAASQPPHINDLRAPRLPTTTATASMLAAMAIAVLVSTAHGCVEAEPAMPIGSHAFGGTIHAGAAGTGPLSSETHHFHEIAIEGRDV